MYTGACAQINVRENVFTCVSAFIMTTSSENFRNIQKIQYHGHRELGIQGLTVL